LKLVIFKFSAEQAVSAKTNRIYILGSATQILRVAQLIHNSPIHMMWN